MGVHVGRFILKKTSCMPGTPNNHFFWDVWWNNHFLCNCLESSNWNKHFKGDVSGTRYMDHMGVSENGGTPKWSILIGFSIINHPFWVYPYFWKHPYGFSWDDFPTLRSPVTPKSWKKLDVVADPWLRVFASLGGAQKKKTTNRRQPVATGHPKN